MPYWDGISSRASEYGIGTTAIVPFMVPVTSVGYSVPIGLGAESTWVGDDSEVVGTARAIALNRHATGKLERCILRQITS
jgi:fumarylacetoacetate (FAA) hydrolase family protein